LSNSVLVDARVVNINWYLNYGQKERQIIFQAEAHTSASISESLIPNGSLDQIASDLVRSLGWFIV
jgi:hypothetical protein